MGVDKWGLRGRWGFGDIVLPLEAFAACGCCHSTGPDSSQTFMHDIMPVSWDSTCLL